MAATLTTSVRTGNEVVITASGFATGATISLYYTTTQPESPVDMEDYSAADKIATINGASGTYTHHNVPGTGTVYYVASDGSSHVSASAVLTAARELDSSRTPVTLNTMDDVTLNIARQNSATSSKKDFNLDINTGHTAIVVLQTANAITDANLATVLSIGGVTAIIGASPTYQLLASESVESVTGYTPQLAVGMQLKYHTAQG